MNQEQYVRFFCYHAKLAQTVRDVMASLRLGYDIPCGCQIM